MSEYYLFVTADGEVRRENHDVVPANGETRVRILNGNGTYILDGTEYSMTLPPPILGNDSDIGSAVLVHMNRQRERFNRDVDRDESRVFVQDDSETIIAAPSISYAGVATLAQAEPSALEIAMTARHNELKDNMYGIRRECGSQVEGIRSQLRQHTDQTADRLAVVEAQLVRALARIEALEKVVDPIRKFVLVLAEAPSTPQ